MSHFMVEARGVEKRIHQTEILRGVDFDVARGEVVSLIGPSGSGKSTFLRCINHLTKITAGYLSVDGELVGYRRHGDLLYELSESETAAKRAEIGMVFQRFNLFAHKTALENVIEAPIQVKREPRRAAVEHAMSLLDRVGLAHKADSYPAELSGGQQQRAAIARALAGSPRLLLADEPTGNLDSQMARSVMELLEEINGQGTTIVMVTHDPELAARAQRNVHIVDGMATDLRREPGLVRAAATQTASP